MADREVIVVDPARQAQQQLLDDMKKLKEKPLDETVPGGVYRDAPDADTFHNAEGQPVSESGKPAKAESESDTPAAKKAAGKRR